MAKTSVPIPTTLTEPLWQAAAEDRLLLQRCTKTGRPQWYPRGHSVHDINAEVEWFEATGRGTILAHTVVHRSPFEDLEAPYVFAIVELEEGVRLSANIVEVDPEDVEAGMPVRVAFQKRGDVSVPVFAPAPTDGQ